MNYTPLPGSVAARAIEHIYALPNSTQVASSALADLIDADRSCMSPCLLAAVKHGVLTARKIDGRISYSRGTGQPLAPPAEPTDDEPDTPAAKRKGGKGGQTGSGSNAGHIEAEFTHRQVSAMGADKIALADDTARSVFDLATPKLKQWLKTPEGQRAAHAVETEAAAQVTKQTQAKTKANTKAAKASQAKAHKPTPAKPAASKPLSVSQPMSQPVSQPTPMRSIAPTAVPQPRPLSCALFNTGDLVIEAPDQPTLRLSRVQARELVTYLQRLDQAINQELTAP